MNQSKGESVPGNNWDQVQEIFFAAADLPPAERASFLAQACKGNPDLRTEVESLLKADAVSGAAIAAAIGTEVSSLLSADAPLTGTRMGPYRLLKEIGRGGMGSVYLGERDDEHYRKLVAIKVVKRGMDSMEVLARFRHERQILASLEHPYIARLIDGGTTPDGRPFFVMEYVQGQPIDVYCRTEKLSIEARLRLFLRVCDAVAYAHRSLVVHRDLKPSNILVNAEGIPKLLDFGVAKLLDPGNDPGLTATLAGMGPLTPEYASPEQIRGLPITTAADVYALGAILFELLTGTRAQRLETRTPAEIERVVCQTDTPRPSTVERVAGSPRIDGDLDNIVLMAMRKEPERRYGSVTRLAEDIQGYLEGKPVMARQDSVVYRARKFLVRHSLAVGAGILIFLSLLGGIVLAEMQAHRAESARQFAEVQRQRAESERERAEAQKQLAEQERERAESQRKLAEQERVRAEAETQMARTEQERSQRRLQQMLQLANSSLFDVHAAIETLPGSTEARRKIVATTLRFLEDLSKDAGQDDDLRFVLSESYFKVADVLGYPTRPNLGDTKGALENYQKSEDFILPLVAKEPNNGHYALQLILTRTNKASLLAATGKTQQAVKMLQDLVPMAHGIKHLCPPKSLCYRAEGELYSELVNILIELDTDAALHYSELQVKEGEDWLKRLPGDEDIEVDLGTSYSEQAKILNARYELRPAVERYKQAAALREKALVTHPSDVITRRLLMITYGNLAGTLGSPLLPNLGDTAGAREYYAKAVAIARDLAKADASNRLGQYDLAFALMYCGTLDVSNAQLAESLANLQEAEGLFQKLVAGDPQAVSSWRSLAVTQQYEALRMERLGRADDALAKARESLASAETALSHSPQSASLVSQDLESEENLAEILADHGEKAEALKLAKKALEQAEHASVAASDQDRKGRFIAIASSSLAKVEATFGDWNAARIDAQRAVDQWRQITAAGSHRVDPVKVAAAEAQLKDCDAHLHQ
jgi:tetratricopeptide (TPR) repeat protein